MTTTIKVSNEVVEVLKKLKKSESYDAYLKSIIGGAVEKIPSVKREQIAFSLSSEYFDAHGNRVEWTELNVTFADLKNAKVNDVFRPNQLNYWYYSEEYLEVVYVDSSSVLVKVVRDEVLEDGEIEDVVMYNVYIL